MPVIIASKNRFKGTVNIPSLNTEVTVIEITGAVDDYLIEGYIDLSALQSGDKVIVREYIAVDGMNYRIFLNAPFSYPVDEPVIRLHTKTLLYDNKFKVTIEQIEGTPPRSFPFAFIQEIMGIA